MVRAFLAECFPTEIPDFHRLCASAIADFVQRQAQRTTTKHAANAVSALRSFLRHLLHRGAIDTDLAVCVPTIATWSLSNIPKFLPTEQIQRVLSSCDRNTAIGKRNYAILLLLARLGLRAGEVVALTLEDLDWEAGLITVRAKCKRVTQMPLTVEAGAAVADYLCQARPHCSCRHVFIRDKAPLVGFANSVAICSLVDRALQRAGVESPYRGSHLFRHSLATQMLKQGASLPEIGDLLRHRRPDTTAIYAKVDLVSLRAIALPCREVADEATARRCCCLEPSRTVRITSSCWRRLNLAGRRTFTPRSRAAARPARVRSRTIDRSNSAKLPSTCVTMRPAAVVVSTASVMLRKPAPASRTRSMMWRRSFKDRESRSSFQTTSTSPSWSCSKAL